MKHNPEPAPFKVKQAALDQLMADLEVHFVDPEQSGDIRPYFLSEEETCQTYIRYLMDQDYPHINMQAVPFFMSISQPVLDHFSDLAGKVDKMEYLGHRQRFGESEAMKVVISHFNLYSCDGNIETIRISLVEYQDSYLILNFDS